MCSHGEADGEHEEGVQAHARCQSEGLLGVDSHGECADDGCECRSGEHRVGVHALVSEVAEDARVDGKDVRHGEEGGDASHHLSLDVVLRRVEAEKF